MSNNDTQAKQFDRRPPVTPSPDNKVEVAKPAPNSNDTAIDGNPDHRISQLSARESHVTIQNLTGHDLVLVDYGKYPNSKWYTYPPSRINYGERKGLEVDSNGFMEGAHGWALYKFADDSYKEYYFQFDVPYIGANYYNYDAPSGYGCNIKGGGGDQAWVTFECWKDNRSSFEKKPPVTPKPETAVEHHKEDKNHAAEDPSDPSHRVLQLAAREAHITIQNLTGHNLIRVDYGKYPLSKWNPEPPSRIDYGDRKNFEVDSNGFMEGAHGWALYKFEDDSSKEYYFQFDDPYIGSNYYNYDAPSGYGCNIKGGSGDHAWVTFECWKDNSRQFDKKPPVAVKEENATTVDEGKRKEGDTQTDAATPDDPGHRVSQLSARESHVTIQNLTGHDLVLVDYGKYPNSKWGTYPPNRINYHERKTFEVDSNGFMEGAHGWALYKFADDSYKEYYFQFDVPYIGSNYYNYDAPSGYGCNIKGGGGDQAWVTFECWKANS